MTVNDTDIQALIALEARRDEIMEILNTEPVSVENALALVEEAVWLDVELQAYYVAVEEMQDAVLLAKYGECL